MPSRYASNRSLNKSVACVVPSRIVVWIDTVKNAEPGYKIRFLTDPNLHWQRRSLEALRRLAANVVTIETAIAP